MLDGAKKHFVFGYMRLPMNGDEVDIEQTKQMVDYFLESPPFNKKMTASLATCEVVNKSVI